MRPNVPDPLFHALALTLTLVAAGCAPSYAPPPRTAHDGAAGRLEAREASFGGAYQFAGTSGEARVRLPATDRLWLEAGGTFGESFALGTLGARINAYDSGRMPVRVVLDVDFGVGAGLGGELCGNGASGESSCDGGRAQADGRGWLDRFAYGGYLGGGIALHVTRGFAPFARVRLQLSETTNVPTTYWGSAVAGVDFRYESVSWYGAIGVGGFTNAFDDEAGLLLETGLTFYVGT